MKYKNVLGFGFIPVRISVQYLWKMVNYVSLPILYQFITMHSLGKVLYEKYGRKIVLLLGGKFLKDILKRWLYLK